jgi:ferredoxin-like protein FixX
VADFVIKGNATEVYLNNRIIESNLKEAKMAKEKEKTKAKVTAKSAKPKIAEMDRKLAKICLICPVCNHARKKQEGLAFKFVQNIEGNLCPFCKAYERVYAKKAHQPIHK